MEKSVKITLIICVTLIFITLLVYTSYNRLTGTTLSSDGIAIVKALPDKIVIYFSLEANDQSAEKAKNTISDIYNKLVSALEAEGIAKEEIKTEGYNVYPDYEWTSNGQKFKGYKAVHSIKIEISSNNAELAGKVIDSGINSGALISYINFELSQELQNQYKTEALKLATEDSKTKAEAVAIASGRKLGKIVSISMSNFNYYPWQTYARAEGATADVAQIKNSVNIQPGDRDVSASVSIVWRLN